jgi:hypothetical protein
MNSGSFVVEPYDYTKKKLEILLAGETTPRRLRAEKTKLQPEDKAWYVFTPKNIKE